MGLNISKPFDRISIDTKEMLNILLNTVFKLLNKNIKICLTSGM